MKFLLLGMVLFALAGCDSLLIKADANIGPDTIQAEHKSDYRSRRDVDPYPDAPNREALSSVSKSIGSVWVVGGEFHSKTTCKIAFAQHGGKFMSYEDARMEGDKPCRYCIDITK